jgi:hypothetical protein
VADEPKPEVNTPVPVVVDEKSPSPPPEVGAPGVTALVVSAPPPKFTEQSESYKAKQAAKDDRREQKRGVAEGPKTKQQDRAEKQRQTAQQQGPFAAIREGVQRRRVDRDASEGRGGQDGGGKQDGPAPPPPWMSGINMASGANDFPNINSPAVNYDGFYGNQIGSAEGAGEAASRASDQLGSLLVYMATAIDRLELRISQAENILRRSFGS